MGFVRKEISQIERCPNFMSTENRGLIFKAYKISQSNYFLLVWVFHTKQLNNRIDSLHEKALRVAYQYKNSSFSELLNLDKSVSVHYRNKIFANRNV